LAIYLAVKAQRRKPTTGKEGLLGSTGIVKSKIDPQGKVFIHGEYWDATSDEMIPEDTQVEVIEVKDIGIKVKKA
jgi:membrane-bound serine protease (ClpP class)